jgi:hypothetical protein
VVPLPQEAAPSAIRPAEAETSLGWPDPLRGSPVDFPRPAGLQYVPGETEDRGAAGPGLRPAAPAPGLVAGRPAGPDRGQEARGHDSGDRAIWVTPGARMAAAPDRSPAAAAAGADWSPASAAGRDQVPAAARDLVPPAAVRQPAKAGTEPPRRFRDPRPAGQPRVSIGTIEVTVVPAATPAPESGRNQAPAPAAPGRPRPASPHTAGMTAGRLTQGLRRWHGIAQG